MYISEAIMENNINASQKMKNRTTIWSNNSIPGYTPEGTERTNLKRYMYPNVHRSIIDSGDRWNQPKCSSTGEWIKMRHIPTLGHYSATKKKKKKNRILPFVMMWMDLHSIVEWNKSEKNKYSYQLHLESKNKTKELT